MCYTIFVDYMDDRKVLSDMYLYDLHCHTSEVSLCGVVPGAELVRRYKKINFDGVVITDHYYRERFEGFDLESEFATHRHPEVTPELLKWWQEKMDFYLSGYKAALEEGKKLGVEVLLGVEIRFPENGNDYLIYGITEEYLRKHPRLYNLGIAELKKYLRETGSDALVFQAHPFRPNMVRADVRYLDGIETLNGHCGHDSQNDKAKEWAKKNKMLESAGTDFHYPDSEGRAGILVDKKANGWEYLLKCLKNKNFEIFCAETCKK